MPSTFNITPHEIVKTQPILTPIILALLPNKEQENKKRRWKLQKYHIGLHKKLAKGESNSTIYISLLLDSQVS